MKRQKLFAVLAALALLFTAFGCKNDDGSNDSCDSSQPEYVGKIYSAKDRKTWLKIDFGCLGGRHGGSVGFKGSCCNRQLYFQAGKIHHIHKGRQEYFQPEAGMDAERKKLFL